MTTTTGTIYEVQAFVDNEWEQIGGARSKILNAEELARRIARERSVKTRIVMIVASSVEEFYP